MIENIIIMANNMIMAYYHTTSDTNIFAMATVMREDRCMVTLKNVTFRP